MITIDTVKIEKMLGEEMEGKLFAHIYVMPGLTVDTMMCTKSYYTALNGKVYQIHEAKLHKSGDTLMSIKREYREIGAYEKGKVYESVHQAYTFEELAKRLKL